MLNAPIVTLDVYLAIAGLFAAIMVGRSLFHSYLRSRRRLPVHSPRKLARDG